MTRRSCRVRKPKPPSKNSQKTGKTKKINPMSTPINDKVKALAPDLTKGFPHSPHAMLGGYILAKRALDKCRADLAGTVGEYHFDCPLDNIFFGFAGLKGADFKEFVATGADDEAVAKWIEQHATKRPRIDI